MLADEIIEVRSAVRGRVPVGTRSPKGAVALKVSFAYWTVRSDAMTVGLEEERRKGKAVFGSLVFEDLSREVLWPWAQRDYSRHVAL